MAPGRCSRQRVSRPQSCTPHHVQSRCKDAQRKRSPEKRGGNWASCRFQEASTRSWPQDEARQALCLPWDDPEGHYSALHFHQPTHTGDGRTGESRARCPGPGPQGGLWASPQAADSPLTSPGTDRREDFPGRGSHRGCCCGAARPCFLGLDRPLVQELRAPPPVLPGNHQLRPPSPSARACLAGPQGRLHMPGTSPSLAGRVGRPGPGWRPGDERPSCSAPTVLLMPMPTHPGRTGGCMLRFLKYICI